MFDTILNLEDLDRKTYFDKFENLSDSHEISLPADNELSNSSNF